MHTVAEMQKCFQLSSGTAKPKCKIRSGEEEEEQNCMIKALKKLSKKKVHCDPAESSDEPRGASDENECKCKCTPSWKTFKLEVNDSHETCFAFAH